MSPITHAELSRFRNSELRRFTHQELKELTNYDLLKILEREINRASGLPKDREGYLPLIVSFAMSVLQGVAQDSVKSVVLSGDVREFFERLIEMLQGLGN